MKEQDYRKIAAESMCDIRTVKRAYAGLTIRAHALLRICVACSKLRLPQPQPKAMA